MYTGGSKVGGSLLQCICGGINLVLCRLPVVTHRLRLVQNFLIRRDGIGRILPVGIASYGRCQFPFGFGDGTIQFCPVHNLLRMGTSHVSGNRREHFGCDAVQLLLRLRTVGTIAQVVDDTTELGYILGKILTHVVANHHGICCFQCLLISRIEGIAVQHDGDVRFKRPVCQSVVTTRLVAIDEGAARRGIRSGIAVADGKAQSQILPV